jgi:hypothetical protein
MKNNILFEDDNEESPILGTWRNVYTLVAGALFFLIVLFYVFTQYFA